MSYEWFIAKKMIGSKGADRQARSSAAIVKIAVAGISIGMTVMIMSVAIVTGFQQEIRQKVISFGSHLQVTLYNPQNTLNIKPMNRNQDFLASIEAEPAVKGLHPFAYKSGIIAHNGEIQGIMAKGVDSAFAWDFFRQNMVAGEPFNWHSAEKTDSIVISQLIVNRLKLELGDKITVTFVQDQQERKRRFTVGGIYDSGMEQFDGSIFLCDLRHIQRLNNWEEDQVAGYEVVLNSFEDLDKLDEIIKNHISYRFNTLKITDQFMEIFGWLDLQDINVWVILSLMVLVSAINMISALLVLILERTNMIGILKALGAVNGSIQNIFIINAGYLILLGLFFGNLIGLALAFAQSHWEIIKLDKSSYYVDHVPILIEPSSLLLLNIGSFAICIIIMYLPALVISRIDPVKTIRFN